MKKQGMINRDIAAALAKFGHTDLLMIADCGLPIPEHVPCVDLSYQLGEPSFESVLKAVWEDFEAEAAFIAEEINVHNPELEKKLQDRFTCHHVSHEQLKKMSHNAKLIIRTGEATPYANVILQSGVIF